MHITFRMVNCGYYVNILCVSLVCLSLSNQTFGCESCNLYWQSGIVYLYKIPLIREKHHVPTITVRHLTFS